jgi:YesN/AraC family two-component response regulator
VEIVGAAGDGAEAVALADERRPDVVLSVTSEVSSPIP